MKKLAQVINIMLVIFIFASCTHLPETAESNKPVPSETPTFEPQASPTATAQFSPADTPQQLIKEDIPAYLTVGLDKRSEMDSGLERYYYGLYYYQIFINFNRDPIEDFSHYNVYFDKTTSVDLDGDGKEEAITLIGGKSDSEYADSYYYDITIDIDGNELKLGKSNNELFELNGTVLDINKDDGKKEMLIYATGVETGWSNYIISYENKKPKKIFDGQLFNLDEPAEGTGYVITQEEDNHIYYNVLWKLKEDRSGFEHAGGEYYPTHYQQYCWGENGNRDEAMAAKTQWDQDLYREPGGKERVSVKEGTPVFIGLYEKSGWLMILDANGELLGWLDTDKVDFDSYTGYAFDLGYEEG